MILGVIPAAGKATRFGGLHKEMLPIADGRCLIDHAIEGMVSSGATAILVITSKEKYSEHVQYLSGYSVPIYFVVQHERARDFWGAITLSFEINADYYLFQMPDTYVDIDGKRFPLQYNFGMGVFLTDRPERFGTLRNSEEGLRISNKEPGSAPSYYAWGLLSWSRKCVEHWNKTQPDSYTGAINDAIDTFGLKLWKIYRYYDMASFNDYLEFINDYVRNSS